MEEMDKTLVKIRPGQVIKGYVVYVNDNEAGVSVGYKMDGFISKEEFDRRGQHQSQGYFEGRRRSGSRGAQGK